MSTDVYFSGLRGKLYTVKLRFKELGYNEYPIITNRLN